MQQYTDERQARRQYVHHRQMRIFSVLAAVMTVVFIVSLFTFFYSISRGNTKEAQAQTNFGAPVVCPSEDQNKNQSLYEQNGNVQVSVYNGTKSVGFAKAVGSALQNRHFSVVSVSNFNSRKVERTTIYYGMNNIAQAYTVYANFTDAKLVMDNRQGQVVSVVLGSTFNNLVDKDSVPAPGSLIKSVEGCTPPSKIDTKKLPPTFEQNAA
jgi:hypothetical protein